VAEREPSSALRILNLANKQLQKALPNLERESGGEARVTAISELILETLELNSDVAVAAILMNQAIAPYSFRHMVDTAVLAGLLGRTMKLAHEELLTVVSAALTMNIAMLEYQDKLNLKRAGLTEEGRSLIRRHPQRAVEILQKAGVSNEDWLACVLNHHESEDGSGYPSAKKGDEIPRNAQLIALADRYSARLMNKYRLPMMPAAAMRDILAGKEFSPTLTAYLVKAVGLYPAGGAVRLKNGQVGIVVKKNAASTGATVRVTISANRMRHEEVTLRDTDRKEFAVQEEVPHEEAGTRPMIDFWGHFAAH
jgi:HD-GYP domain-containing protein (c-di-GMP phosphodiesterase class II)